MQGNDDIKDDYSFVNLSNIIEKQNLLKTLFEYFTIAEISQQRN
jgi:hypothetical protein